MAKTLTVYRDELHHLALSKPRQREVDDALFSAESGLGTKGAIALIDTLELDDLHTLSETADGSLGSPLLQLLSPEKFLDLLTYRMHYEERNHLATDGFVAILLGTLFSDNNNNDENQQLAYLDAVFIHHSELLPRFCLLLEKAFTIFDQEEGSPFLSSPAASYDPDLEPLGMFTKWFSQFGEESVCEDQGILHFCLLLCRHRPEYAMALTDAWRLLCHKQVPDRKVKIETKVSAGQESTTTSEESMF